MKINRALYAGECGKHSSQVESLKTKLQKARIDENVLENGITSNSKVICELLDLDLYEVVNKHPEAKLNIRIGNEEIEMEIHKSNVKKLLKL
jgi:hypothetical protein